jgi:hypothetical protein
VKRIGLPAVCALWMISQATSAAANDAAREEMQRALNAETMASPFNPGDVNRALAFAQDAKRRNVVPVQQPPSYWMPGWTCASMTGYAHYDYSAYRNCVYYHHYYGRYWR